MNYQERQEANKRVRQTLNERKLKPDAGEGKVELVTERFVPGDRLRGDRYEQDEVDCQALARELGFEHFAGFVEEHPEGSDRGGYVPTVHFYNGDNPYGDDAVDAHYDENFGEWSN